MTVVIFCGPSLASADVPRGLQVDVRPPAVRGDVLRAALSRPAAIALIDGYFHQVPAVWHKEILWAMSEGIHVFGAASMGALRAAELVDFGMEGVGAVFEMYRDGILEDDDEVAVVHTTDEFGFRAGSEAMVDIRRTLARATDDGVLSASTAAAIQSLAKSMFYPDRNYQLIVKRAAEQDLPRAELTAMVDWLPTGRASQKRADALLMLRVIRERVSNGLQPKQVNYAFENSWMWEQAKRSMVAPDGAGSAR